jgi:hypothetical protein
MKSSQHHPESLRITLVLQRLEPNRLPSMHVMKKKRLPKRSVVKVIVHMKMSDVYVKIHSAGRTRIGSVENRALHPRSMPVFPNQEARFLSEAKSELIMKR